MRFRKYAGLMVAAGLCPVAAEAECLGDSCNNALGGLLAGAIVVVLIALAAFIFVAVRVYRRKGGKGVALFAGATLVGGYLLLVGWGGY